MDIIIGVATLVIIVVHVRRTRDELKKIEDSLNRIERGLTKYFNP